MLLLLLRALLLRCADLLTPQASFDAISEQLLVGPVVRTLVYDKIPNTVCDWVDSICADWRFERIIPAHFSAPVRAGEVGGCLDVVTHSSDSISAQLQQQAGECIQQRL
eukprot:GHRQ01036429.1.p3 GENE.GHRQ01036429.1~~GHRQ01036429.1.p3  ORF type:complete len:109 (+),score=41.12 GHRQ01036429.1:41-367(+)